MRRFLLFCALSALASGCNVRGDRAFTDEAPPPAAALVAGRGAGSLSEQLGEFTAVLDTTMAGQPSLMFTAEAMTDQLLTARRNEDWLASGYDVEARVRQLQAMADGIVARMRRGFSLDELKPEIETLRAAAVDLREQLAQPGGGAAPPSLDSLLSQDPLRDVSSSAVPASDSADRAGSGTGGPLGRPVDSGGG